MKMWFNEHDIGNTLGGFELTQIQLNEFRSTTPKV